MRIPAPPRCLTLLSCLLLLISVASVKAQYQPPSDYLLISADRAYTWTEGSTNVVQLQGPLTIQTDRALLSADRAVIWLTPVPGTVLDQQRAEIALLGNARLEQPQQQVLRSGQVLFIETQVRGTIRITANARIAQNLSDTDLYRDASSLRPVQNIVPGSQPLPEPWMIPRPWLAPPMQAPAATAPTTRPVRPAPPVSFRFQNAQTVQTPEDRVALVLSGDVLLMQTDDNGDRLELRAERAVLFTPLRSLRELGQAGQFKTIEQAITAAYLEGDVRIVLTPRPRRSRLGEQRLRAQRVYYDFTTDRAVLTDAVLHTIEPQRQIPLVVRAHKVRQLSRGEYRAENLTLSTSSFAVPSYSIYADRAYIRQYDSGDPRLGQRTIFDSRHNFIELYDVPVFYWPWVAGAITEHGFPLRELLFGSSRGFGPGVRTRWGLFESIGRPPPQDLDLSYRLDYFNDRGPAAGLDAEYGGGFITETTKQPWNFQGEFTSYFVFSDDGEDRLGRRRVQQDGDLRYRALWKHQHFLPDNWQVQLRAGLVSDPTFLEEWFQQEFEEADPHDLSFYLKRQQQSQAMTFLLQTQPNDVVTTADSLQENFEVARLPELGYYRIGDSFGQDDRFTFFSANTLSALQFDVSNADFAEMGFRRAQDPFPPGRPAGFPSIGQTGIDRDTTYRADLRQQIDAPFSAGPFRIVPYIMARYTPYSDSPDGSNAERLLAGAGVRMTTALWRVDDTARNDLLDIHRLRHVIEPELHAFTSAATEDRSSLFIYDEPVDAISDISAVQLAVHQRWQTRRGGAGRWRSVDFFTLNTELNLFANQPSEAQLAPSGFRGLFFPSLPEASIPRNSANTDALWRISDTTAVLADAQYNLDEMTLATTSIGLAVQRESRVSYFLGTRYIGELNSTIATLAANYIISPKYQLRFSQSYRLNQNQNQNMSVTLTRRFDRFFMTFTFFYDAIDDESGFRFGLFPEGLGYGLTSDQFQRVFGGEQ